VDVDPFFVHVTHADVPYLGAALGWEFRAHELLEAARLTLARSCLTEHAYGAAAPAAFTTAASEPE
jgi:hypothetical protein